MRLFVVILALVVAVPVAAVLVTAHRSGPPAGLTREQAQAAAADRLRCPGRPAPRIVRCTARDDAWECEYEAGRGQGGTVTLGDGFGVVPLC